jgi:hypothetical protein
MATAANAAAASLVLINMNFSYETIEQGSMAYLNVLRWPATRFNARNGAMEISSSLRTVRR